MKKKDKENAKAMEKLKDSLERKRSFDQTTFNKKGHEEQFKHTQQKFSKHWTTHLNSSNRMTTKLLLRAESKLYKTGRRGGLAGCQRIQSKPFSFIGEIKRQAAARGNESCRKYQEKIRDIRSQKKYLISSLMLCDI